MNPSRGVTVHRRATSLGMSSFSKRGFAFLIFPWQKIVQGAYTCSKLHFTSSMFPFMEFISSQRASQFFSICSITFLCRALVNRDREVNFAFSTGLQRGKMGKMIFFSAKDVNSCGYMYAICKIYAKKFVFIQREFKSSL